MTKDQLFEKIRSIKSWKAHGKRAPHKPLLVLYALGQLQAGKSRVPYSQHQEPLKNLLEEFGPPSNPRPYYPFVRLSNDGFWKVDALEKIDPKQDYPSKRLTEAQAQGMFTPEVARLLQNAPGFVNEVAEYLLEENFPATLHDDILQAAGLELETGLGKKTKIRDPRFRQKILEAYERSCAICGYQIRRDDQVVGLEAAHIKWHQAGGPDVEQNGIAMCTMHHKLFDHGLFALDEKLIFKVSTKANGNGAKEWLLRFHDKPIRPPQSRNFYPEQEFTNWQVKEVFKGGYRG